MNSITQYERGNIARFWVIFFAALGSLIVTCCFILAWIVYTLGQQGTLDILDLFTQDWDIIREYFPDILSILFWEMPPVLLGFFLIMLMILLFVLIFTRKTRTITLKKESEIRKLNH